MSLKTAEDERDMSKTIWYDTSFAELKSGAAGGCSWCQLFLKLDERPGERSVRTFWDSKDLRSHFHKLVVFTTEHSEGSEYFVYTNPGASDTYAGRRCLGECSNDSNAAYHQKTPQHPTSQN